MRTSLLIVSSRSASVQGQASAADRHASRDRSIRGSDRSSQSPTSYLCVGGLAARTSLSPISGKASCSDSRTSLSLLLKCLYKPPCVRPLPATAARLLRSDLQHVRDARRLSRSSDGLRLCVRDNAFLIMGCARSSHEAIGGSAWNARSLTIAGQRRGLQVPKEKSESIG